MSVLTPTRSAVSLSSSFDSALYVVSECITEARCFEESGDAQRAHLLYRFAERYALRTGFMELMRLVWTYQDHR